MKNMSDYSGEEAIEICGELLEPMCEVLADKDFRKMYDDKATKLEMIKYLTKHHAKEIIHMLAILDGEDPATYKVSIMTLPIKLMQLLSDPMLASLFPSQGQTTEKTSSGSAMENIEAEGN